MACSSAVKASSGRVLRSRIRVQRTVVDGRDSGVLHERRRAEGILEVGGSDLESAKGEEGKRAAQTGERREESLPLDLEDLFEAVDDVDVALGVKLADVAGVEPVLVVERLRGGFGVVEV